MGDSIDVHNASRKYRAKLDELQERTPKDIGEYVEIATEAARLEARIANAEIIERFRGLNDDALGARIDELALEAEDKHHESEALRDAGRELRSQVVLQQWASLRDEAKLASQEARRRNSLEVLREEAVKGLDDDIEQAIADEDAAKVGELEQQIPPDYEALKTLMGSRYKEPAVVAEYEAAVERAAIPIRERESFKKRLEEATEDALTEVEERQLDTMAATDERTAFDIFSGETVTTGQTEQRTRIELGGEQGEYAPETFEAGDGEAELVDVVTPGDDPVGEAEVLDGGGAFNPDVESPSLADIVAQGQQFEAPSDG